ALDIANSEFNGKYMFNGQMTDRPPYPDADNLFVESDPGIINLEIGAGVTLGVNKTGSEVFGRADAEDNVFKLFDNIMGFLDENDYNGLSDTIDSIQTRLDSILEIRSDIGAKTNRIELAQGRLEDIGINLQTLQSKTEDADIAEVITNLK